jgi:hypothetical protein
VRGKTRPTNQIHAALIRQLEGRAPTRAMLGKKSRAWLAELDLDVAIASSPAASTGSTIPRSEVVSAGGYGNHQATATVCASFHPARGSIGATAESGRRRACADDTRHRRNSWCNQHPPARNRYHREAGGLKSLGGDASSCSASPLMGCTWAGCG